MRKSCYTIGPTGEPGSKEHAWADTISEYVIGPAVGETRDQEPGSIIRSVPISTFAGGLPAGAVKPYRKACQTGSAI